MRLAHDRGGHGSRLLVLLHGLGATRQVWRPMLKQARWRGSWLAPDLRGHGASPHGGNYALGAHAMDVAELILEAGRWDEIVVLGHSMGGVVALALASHWFGVSPARVFGIGIKVAWTDAEFAQLKNMACAPVRWFATQEEATERYLKVSGLSGMATVDSEMAASGVVPGEHGWRLAVDPATASVGPPPMPALTAATHVPFHLARGESDAMVSQTALLAYDAGTTEFIGAGHNAMVEKPDAIWQWLEEKCS